MSSNDDVNKNIVRAYSRQFHNLYLFVTETCQLRCEHCYMGERLIHGQTMSFEKARNVMEYFYRLGSRFITFVGGEPTLHPELNRIVDCALSVGYSKVMLDSNGLLVDRIKKIDPSKLYYVRISLDGASALTHDKVRGTGSFDKTVFGIKELVNAGYKVRVTSTVFQFSLQETSALLELVDSLGVELLNLHTFSEEGNGSRHPDWSLNPVDWISYYKNLESIKHKFKIRVRYPPTWGNVNDLRNFKEKGFMGCLGCSLDRISVFPDGRCYVCSVLFDTQANFGFLTEDGLVLNKADNEYEMFIAASFKANNPWESGCPAETYLARKENANDSDKLISMCRLWRTEIP